MVGLALIVGGAELFVEELTSISKSAGVSPIVLALILAPLATELPEKVNSVLWIRKDRDALATGNITGAMVFQATVPVAILLFLIDWSLDRFATAAALVAMVGGGIALWRLRRQVFGLGSIATFAGLFIAFVVFVAVS